MAFVIMNAETGEIVESKPAVKKDVSYDEIISTLGQINKVLDEIINTTKKNIF